MSDSQNTIVNYLILTSVIGALVWAIANPTSDTNHGSEPNISPYYKEAIKQQNERGEGWLYKYPPSKETFSKVWVPSKNTNYDDFDERTDFYQVCLDEAKWLKMNNGSDYVCFKKKAH
jgi:hypothetical protein